MNCIFASKDNLWSNNLFNMLKSQKSINWLRAKDKNDLSIHLDNVNPDWIFFFHWSSIVSSRIWENLRCVTIHTSNLPEGRGGSPIQNQIIDGVVSSRINAIKMSDTLDGGPVYCSLPVTLQGSLTDIWLAISHQTKVLIEKCIEENLVPSEQELGFSNLTKRRKTSQIPVVDISSITTLHDYIRMLDAEGYPKSQFNIGKFSIELSRSSIEDDSILCDARIRVLK
jgi:methionyl-tRNA formyltransferase